MANTIASIQGVAYRETPPFIHELPSRPTGNASHAASTAIGDALLPSDAVDLIARIPESADSKEPQKRQDQDRPASSDAKADGANQKASAAEQWEVQELQETDRRVRAHERAHMAAGGNLVSGGATYQFKTGPDGQRYAVGGEVDLDTSPVKGDPAATKRKAERIRRAALAPADPSPQDRYVAAQAEAMASRASQEQVQEKLGTGPKTDGAPTAMGPDAMPHDRPAVIDPQSKSSPSGTKSERSESGTVGSDRQVGGPDEAHAAGKEEATDPLPHISPPDAGQGLPAVLAYRSPSAVDARAHLNVLA